MPASRLCRCSVVLHNVTDVTGETDREMQPLCVLTTACESAVISKQEVSSLKKKKEAKEMEKRGN